MACEEAIILAGGKGTRLRSVVSDVPKPLAIVAGRPFLAYVLDHLAESGIRKCILATGYLSEMIEAAIGNEWAGMDIAYSVEAQPMGTGGAVANAAKGLSGPSTHVLNGDTFLQYSPKSLELRTRRAGREAGVALAHVPDVARYGAAIVDQGRLASFQEKGGSGSGLINAGSYFFDEGVLKRMVQHDGAFSLETEVLLPLAQAANLEAYAETDSFIDIGVPEDYARAQHLFGHPR